jgi:drug/metabolite transporter (DMT)-like permease
VNKPLLLLFATGALLGLYFPLGKIATGAGVNPVLWACMISLGAGLSTAVVSRFAEPAVPTNLRLLRYAGISGTLSNVVPHFLTFSAIPHIGAGLAAILVALSPVTTALLSLVFRVRPPGPLGLAGVFAGLIGALIIILGRNDDFGSAAYRWLLLATLIPVFLGLGNIYRTAGWPSGAPPMQLASLTNLAAVPPLLLIAALSDGGIDLRPLLAVPGLAAGQIAVSSIAYVMFFRLQQLGGPTYLSQIGYVSAVVGVGIGVTMLHEAYPLSVWIGTTVVAFGIGLATIAQVRAAASAPRPPRSAQQ